MRGMEGQGRRGPAGRAMAGPTSPAGLPAGRAAMRAPSRRRPCCRTLRGSATKPSAAENSRRPACVVLPAGVTSLKNMGPFWGREHGARRGGRVSTGREERPSSAPLAGEHDSVPRRQRLHGCCSVCGAALLSLQAKAGLEPVGQHRQALREQINTQIQTRAAHLAGILGHQAGARRGRQEDLRRHAGGTLCQACGQQSWVPGDRTTRRYWVRANSRHGRRLLSPR